ncbi:zf PARP type zinc finger protein Hpz2 [Schizosaccharomyces osmophilus]|uniref:Zf PARP type zinc finger protein Hpz2 n=1 Tax=Schizosaccharomyces osmophilus TaxID=2545709 RepID=A0AAE9WCU3_9SCHI|nr:zf PARP type zinc finger protein Hpz2 [Schizosaccharomyces osmophilus]WBW73904.1 zf PARP type zinc finger protein Hpz2 [Schizosaccharomyces osmophilus]
MEQGGSGYRVEIAANSRSKCKGSLCGRAKIPAGVVRFGTFVDSGRFQSWAWKHWGCVTPRMLKNIKNRLGEDDLKNTLDGITALPDECIDKIIRAVQEGHVDVKDERESRKIGNEVKGNTAVSKKPNEKQSMVPPKVARKTKRHHVTTKSVLSDSGDEAEYTNSSEEYDSD